MTSELQRSRIAAAHREGTRQRLIRSDRIPQPQVDAWLAAWEASSEDLDGSRSGSEFWQRAYAGIVGERAAGRKPAATDR
jgi:hypothetical protein